MLNMQQGHTYARTQITCKFLVLFCTKSLTTNTQDSADGVNLKFISTFQKKVPQNVCIDFIWIKLNTFLDEYDKGIAQRLVY